MNRGAFNVWRFDGPFAGGAASTTGSGAITLGALSPVGSGGFKTTASGTITLGSIIVTSAASGGGAVALYLPYNFTSVLLTGGNTDPWGIDPEKTTIITSGLTSSD